MGTHTEPGHSPFGSNAKRVAEIEAHIADLRKELVATRNEGAARANVANYSFTTTEGAPVHLTDLFGEHDDLLVIHNMGERCQYCALWADGLSAFVPQFSRRAALVLATPNDPASARKQIATRGWKFRVVCDGGTSFARDMGFEGESVSHGTTRLPGVSAFHRERDATCADGVRITRVGAAQFGPGDEFCSVWGLFDLLTEGVRGWAPQAPYSLPS
jgi:predicted dithiol-disulfide oxidoreductase (DUF899 family)